MKREQDYPLAEIHDVEVTQNLFGLILNYGTLRFTCGFGDVVLLEGVPSPSSVRNLLSSAGMDGGLD